MWSSWLPSTAAAPDSRAQATTPAESGPFATRSPTSTTRSPAVMPAFLISASSSSKQPWTSPMTSVRGDGLERAPMNRGGSALADADLVHLDRRLRPVARSARRLRDGVDDLHARDHLAEHRVLRLPRREPVEVPVVDDVDEELRAARVRAGVGHRQRAARIGDLRVGQVLVLDAPMRAVTRAGARTVRILAVRAAELDHELVDHAVEVKPVVEAFLGERDEISGGDRHLVGEKLDLDVAHGGRERRGGVCHAAHGNTAFASYKEAATSSSDSNSSTVRPATRARSARLLPATAKIRSHVSAAARSRRPSPM